MRSVTKKCGEYKNKLLFLSSKFKFFPLILIYSKEKGKKLFYNNLGIHRVTIYITVSLMILLKGYRV